MDVNILIIGLISSGGMFLIPIVSWLDTLLGIPLMFICPSAYIYYVIMGYQPLSLNDFPIYLIFLWLSIPIGFIIGITLEIILVPSFIFGSIGLIYFLL